MLAKRPMELAVSAFNWSRTFEVSDIDLLPRVRENGFAAFEIPIFDPARIPVTELRRAFEANDLSCTVCCILTGGLHPAGADAGERKRARAHLAACIETAAELGAALMGGPMCAPIGYLPGRRSNPEEWRWAVECFQSLGDLLDRHGMTLAIEPVNRAETYLITTTGDAAALSKEIDHSRIGVLLDTFHANIEEKSIAKAITLLGSQLKHVHLSENDRGILGSGHIDFAAILSALRDIDYGGYLVIEGLGCAFPSQDGSDFMWRQHEEPEAIVFGGAAYLRELSKITL